MVKALFRWRAVLLAVLLLIAPPDAARAQLFPANGLGMAMGHVLVNVTDVEAHTTFWVTQFDAVPVTVGQLRGVKIPGLVVLFRRQPPTGPGDGEIINHLGLKLIELAGFTARFGRAGYAFEPTRIGREGTPQTYVTGPDTFRIELVEDPRLPAPVVSHHLHYWLVDPAAVKRWYVDTLLLAPTMRGPYESGDLPGMNLTMSPLGQQPGPGVATKGRLLDSIGFEVKNLAAYCERIRAHGATFDVPYGRDPELGIQSATLTDPWGVTVRLTEGLAALAGVTPYTYIDGYVVAKP
jgi:catechol 2,3-dioxygenase-like lactoylglutathione lyase family enzyme